MPMSPAWAVNEKNSRAKKLLRLFAANDERVMGEVFLAVGFEVQRVGRLDAALRGDRLLGEAIEKMRDVFGERQVAKRAGVREGFGEDEAHIAALVVALHRVQDAG